MERWCVQVRACAAVSVSVCACVHACMHGRVRACVECMCVRACVRVGGSKTLRKHLSCHSGTLPPTHPSPNTHATAARADRSAQWLRGAGRLRRTGFYACTEGGERTSMRVRVRESARGGLQSQLNPRSAWKACTSTKWCIVSRTISSLSSSSTQAKKYNDAYLRNPFSRTSIRAEAKPSLLCTVHMTFGTGTGARSFGASTHETCSPCPPHSAI
eukprot:4867143-Pleurochrysis_carterae.AAC.2